MLEKLVQPAMLPIEKFKELILEALMVSQFLVIGGDTGCGKSTKVPQILLEILEKLTSEEQMANLAEKKYKKYKKITVAVPSRTAATSLAQRVSDELGYPLGTKVGYQTAFERAFSPETQILYTTEGLQLIKELNDDEGDEDTVLIIDELQEWSINIEALIGFLRYKVQNGFKTKIILMSATIDENIAGFFDNAPIIRVPGRLFPIKVETSNNMLTTIARFANNKQDVLAFVPGKSDISDTIAKLEEMHLDAEIFPMHADLALEDQLAVFNPCERPKVIVATNVAQTSITIPGITAVVDSGLKLHEDLIDGLKTLTIGNISQNDRIQRMGRAGRTQPGTYVWCGDVHYDYLAESSTPDILIGDITQVVLRLASVGIDAEDIPFFHQPPQDKFDEAKKTLRVLGAFDKNNQITEIGRIMARLPVSVIYARMLVEAEKRDVLEDVLTIASIQECGGIKDSRVPYPCFPARRDSDMLADLECFNNLRKTLRESNWPFCYDRNPFQGINKRNYFRIIELRAKLADVLYNIYGDVTSSGNREQISLSCAAGLVEHLYIRLPGTMKNPWYESQGDACRRKLDNNSTVFTPPMLLGIPKNLSLRKKVAEAETQVLYLICNAMAVTIDMLKEVAPHLLNVKEEYVCDPNTNTYKVVENTFFVDQLIDYSEAPIQEVATRRDMLSSWLSENTFNPDSKNHPQLNVVLRANRKKLSTFNEAKNFYSILLKKTALNSVPSMAKPKNYGLLHMR